MSHLSRRQFIQLGLAATTLSPALAASLSSQGALQGAVAHAAEPGRVRSVKGFCPFCQVRCTWYAQVQNNTITSITGDSRNRWTGGAMCPKGLSLMELVQSPYRLVRPLLRVARGKEEWKAISYAEAIDLVAEKLGAALKKSDGVKRVALTAPLWDCRESELAALMTLRKAGVVNVMPPGEVCISTASNVLNMLLGANTSTTTVDQITHAETLVLWGVNLSETYPPYTRWLDKARADGVDIVGVDCRATATTAWTKTRLMPLPGTDGALALGAIRHILETSSYSPEAIERLSTGFDLVQKGVAQWTPARVANTCGLPEAQIADFYAKLAKSRRTIIWMGGCLSRYTNGIQTVRSLITLQALRDNLIGSGRGVLTMEGGKPEGEKEFIDAVCGPVDGESINFRRLLASLKKGDMDVIFLNSSYRRYPDCNAVAEALKKAHFVVARGFFKTEEMDVADLFVPAAFGPESAGSHYGAEKQVVWRDKCVDAPGECVSDWQFYRDIGRKLFPDYPDFSDPAELCDRFCATVPSWQGMSVDSLRASPDGIVWPLPRKDAQERTGSIFTDKVHTENGKIPFNHKLLGNYTWTAPKGSPYGPDFDPNFPLVLTQGKVVTQWQQTVTNFAASLAQFSSGRTVQVHPETAQSCGVANNDRVLLETSLGGIEARAVVTPTIRPGVVFTASHFAESSPHAQTRSKAINSILPNSWDRISAQFNGVGCRLVKI